MTDRVNVPERDPKERAKDFAEVSGGYTPELAEEEASRCLNCPNPRCVKGCPVNVPIPQFISEIKKGDYLKANEVLKTTNSLPAVCGRVCPQEEQCEKLCILSLKGKSVAIGALERFAADQALAQGATGVAAASAQKSTKKKKAAVVGSGPAGLTCAGDLARAGFEVTVYEALHKAGGVLIYGIPEFRLAKSIVQKEVDSLEKLGVKFVLNALIGRTFTLEQLLEENDAVFVGSGAGLPKFMNIPGENLMGVYSANEYLTRINLMKAYLPDNPTPIKKGKKVAVVGGGNVAMDSARSALRLGADEVHIVYRRTKKEMPARVEEIHHAEEEGILFDELCSPVEILSAEGKVAGLQCVRMELGEPDASGRRSPVEIEGSEFVIEADTVIMAIGTTPNPLLSSVSPQLKTDRKGCIIVDEATMESAMAKVYAGGDAVTGAATVILAMGAGKRAAKAIIERVQK